MTDGFAAVWDAHKGAVFGYLLRLLHDPDAADEVLQRAAIRAWRGFATFQGRCQPSTWLLRIAGNEANRWLSAKRFAALDAAPEPAAKTDQPPPAGWDSRHAITQATAAGLLSDAEARVLAARQDAPDAPWTELAAAVGLSSANNAAQVHVRAVTKLRVFLFVHRPDLCGSKGAIAEAFERACGRPVDPLTPAEQRVFRVVVLDRTTAANAPGHWTDIQSACRKVAAHLAPDRDPEGPP